MMRLPVIVALAVLALAPASAQVNVIPRSPGPLDRVSRSLPNRAPPPLDLSALRARIKLGGPILAPAEAPITASGEVGPTSIVDGTVYLRVNHVSLWAPGGMPVAEMNGGAEASNWIVNYASGPTAYAIDCRAGFDNAKQIAFEYWDDGGGKGLGTGTATYADNHVVAALPPYPGKNIAVRFLPKLSDGTGRLWGCRVLKIG